MEFKKINENDVITSHYKLINEDLGIYSNDDKIDLKKIRNFVTIKLSKYFSNLEYIFLGDLAKFSTYILFQLKVGLNIETDKNQCETFLNQLSMNNDRNFLEIIYLFFPYIDDKDNFTNQKQIKNIDQITNEKINDIDNKLKFTNYKLDHLIHENVEYSFQSDYLKKLKLSFSKKNITDFYFLLNIYTLILNNINSIRYKLYINWLNTFPINLTNYKKSLIYSNSFKLDESDGFFKINYNNQNILLNFPNVGIITNEMSKEINSFSIYDDETTSDLYNYSCILPFIYSGINLEDIYNTLSNDYYYDSKRNKWLFFEIIQDESHNLLNIKCLDTILNLDSIIENKPINLLSEKEKSTLTKNWSNFLKSLDKKENSKLFKKLDYNSRVKILTYFVSYFEFHYDDIRTLEKEGKYIYLHNNKKYDEIDDEDIKFLDQKISIRNKVEFTIEDVIKSIKNVPYEDIYNFIFQEVNEIKDTVYNSLLFNEDGFLKDLKFKKSDMKITPKNYYNFGKSLNLDNNGNRMSKTWEGLSIMERYLISFRLNTNEKSQTWFNIKSILNKLNYNDVNTTLSEIYKKIRKDIIDITFENLVRKGCICIFEVNKSVTDINIITNDYNQKKKNLEKNFKKDIFTKERKKEYENSYYYATNKKYKDLEKIVIKNKKFKNLNKLEHDSGQVKLTYLEYLENPTITGDVWYSFYAMDWASQINFFIKLINKRVTYVTGATGQGKSTQVPKLYLFGLKSILYKNNAKILCTAPRIGPVLENSKSISKSMGLPIETYNKNFDDVVRTLNSVVQYQYANDKHVDINQNYYLKIITDGILLKTLQQNQILKKKISFRNENKFNPKSIYNDRNVCDLVIIDEAHEHNKNMDLILTIMKYTLFYNNDIRLSIISATMDEDEPIFRKFYRIIDDNLSYPISTYNLQNKVNSNIIDRRYHISPPGESTQYEILEYYEENSADTYEENKSLAIKRISKIFNSTESGDILAFSTTQKKIYEIAIELNKIIPPNCVVLPYYSNLEQEYQEYSKKADSKVSELDIDRNDLLDLFLKKKTKDQCAKVKKGTYNRCCIIATNAAEASLTIVSLVYVVDLGFQLRIKYDYEKMEEEILENEKITEASRKQRKGRVGRVRNGFVYHMYPKDSRVNVKSEYNISSDDFSDTFKDLLVSDATKDSEIMPKNIMRKLLTLEDLNTDDKTDLNRTRRILYNQYKLNDKFYDSESKCVFIEYDEYYDYGLLKTEFDYYFPSYSTGFDSKSLLDTSGHFYLIHPLETKLHRDLLSQNITDKDFNYNPLQFEEIKLIALNAILKEDIIEIPFFGFTKNFKVLEFNDINLKLNSYKQDYLKLFSYSLVFDKTENKEIISKVTFIFKLLENIQYDFKNLIEKDQIRQFYETNKKFLISDLEFFINLYDDIFGIINFDKITIKEDKKITNLSNDLITFFSNQNIKQDFIYKFIKKKSLSKDIFNQIVLLILKKDFTFDGIKDDELNSNDNIDDFLNKNDLEKYCKMNNLNSEVILKTIKSFYNEIYKKIMDENYFKKYENNINNLTEMVNVNKPTKINDIIILCYSMTYFYNLYFYNSGKYFKYIKSITVNLGDTLLKNFTDLGIFINLNKTAKILINVTKDTVIDIAPLLIMFQSRQNSDYLNYKDYTENITSLTKKLTSFSYNEDGIKIKNEKVSFEDKNFLNILMKQIITAPESIILNQDGGNLQYIGKISKKLLNNDNFKKLFNENNVDINKYNYAYINLQNSQIKGLNLIKNKENISTIHVLINDEYLNNY